MRTGLAAVLLLSIALLLAWLWRDRSPTQAPARRDAVVAPSRFAQQFPPPRARRIEPPAPAPVRPRDRRILELGQRPPRFPSADRQAFEDTDDLLAFVLGLTPRALTGDGEARYLIYLALDQCRSFLRLGEAEAWEMNQRMLYRTGDLADEEVASWEREYARCHRFAGGDWAAVGDALGADRPGAETEYASVWFVKAVASGHPAALAEQALRPGPIAPGPRREMLLTALQAPDPDVLWLMFAHSGDVQTGVANANSLAWLLLACRAGANCSESARWYRGYVCAQDRGCLRGQSALAHYWYSASEWERDQAWGQAATLESALRTGATASLRLPDFAPLDTRRIQPGAAGREAGEGGDG